MNKEKKETYKQWMKRTTPAVEIKAKEKQHRKNLGLERKFQAEEKAFTAKKKSQKSNRIK